MCGYGRVVTYGHRRTAFFSELIRFFYNLNVFVVINAFIHYKNKIYRKKIPLVFVGLK